MKKDTLIEEFNDFLQDIIDRKNIEKQQKKIAQNLKLAMRKIKTLDAFCDILRLNSPTLYLDVSAGNNIIITKRQNMLRQITELQASKLRVIAKLATYENLNQDNGFILLLKEILNDPNFLLQRRAGELFKQIETYPELDVIVEYMLSQPHAEKPLVKSEERRGAFSEIEPLNDAHAKCLDILHNNSQTFHKNRDNLKSRQAMNLLQTLLIVYQDIKTIEPDSDVARCVVS